MADDVQISAGSGTSVATDEIASRHFQRVKVTHGPDGTANDASPATPLPTADTATVLTGSATAIGSVIGPFDASSFVQMVIAMSGTYSATVVLQGSPDQTTWTTMGHSINLSASAASPPLQTTSALTTGNNVRSTVVFPYYRLQVTAYTSGTVNATIWLSRFQPVTAVTTEGGSGLPVAATASGGVTHLDGQTGGGASWGLVTQIGFGYNGATWDRLRTPTTFKSVSTQASGNTALWTPTSGKKFRLLRYKVSVTQDASMSGGGELVIGFQDATTDLGLSESVYVPTTAATTLGPGWSTPWIDLGNGRVSAAINQVLNVNLGTALSTGKVRVVACGTEE